MKFFLLYFLLSNKNKKGFTLIELLIVIAILGVLAASLLAFIDPFEQLARSRDAGRKSTITQLGKAIDSNFLATGGTKYLASWTGSNWLATLEAAGGIKTIPGAPTGSTPCSAGANGNGFNNFCFIRHNLSTDTPPGPVAIIYTIAESKSEKIKCPGVRAYIVWSSADGGKVGTVCKTAGTGLAAADTLVPGIQTFQ